jgi:hypothetical protein
MRKFNITVFGMKTKVVLTPTVEHGGERVAGLFNPMTSTISVATEGMSDTQIIHTFFHELFHSVFYRVGIYNAQVSRDIEEIIVDNMATVVTEMLYNNIFENLLTPKKITKKKK